MSHRALQGRKKHRDKLVSGLTGDAAWHVARICRWSKEMAQPKAGQRSPRFTLAGILFSF
jgi:hypothetical protein